MRKTLTIIGIIFAFVLVGAGGFFGGMIYQETQVTNIRDDFMRARGFSTEMEFPAGAPPMGGRIFKVEGDFVGAPTMGVVKTNDGEVLTISTAEDVTTVNLSTDTRIEKTTEGSAADLPPGTRVLITGEEDDNGNITASQITILNEDMPIIAYPPPSETEP